MVKCPTGGVFDPSADFIAEQQGASCETDNGVLAIAVGMPLYPKCWSLLSVDSGCPTVDGLPLRVVPVC